MKHEWFFVAALSAITYGVIAINYELNHLRIMLKKKGDVAISAGLVIIATI